MSLLRWGDAISPSPLDWILLLPVNRISALLFRTLVWTLAGAVFGGLYGALSAAFAGWAEYSWGTTTLATALGGAITAAFFGTMLTALLGAMIGVVVSVVYLVVFPQTGEFVPLTVIAAGLAFLAGSLLPQSDNLIIRPIAQALSGLLAGLVAGPLAAIAASLFDWNVQSTWAAGFAVAAVGVMFLVFSHWIAPSCPDWLSSRFSSPVVAAIVASTTAAALWLIGSSIGQGSGHLTTAEVDMIFSAVPQCAAGGAIGGAIGGIAMEMLGIERRAYRV